MSSTRLKIINLLLQYNNKSKRKCTEKERRKFLWTRHNLIQQQCAKTCHKIVVIILLLLLAVVVAVVAVVAVVDVVDVVAVVAGWERKI